MADEVVPGWFGKLPSLGDFASRRLPPSLLEVWDHWLASGLQAWCERDPSGWLAGYLACPSWRFVLMPGVVGAGPLAGVLMPSVDRAGRYFPLTLMQSLRRLPGDSAEVGELLAWLHRLDDLALDVLQEDWPVDRLEAELGLPAQAPPAWAVDALQAPVDPAGRSPPWPGASRPVGPAVWPLSGDPTQWICQSARAWAQDSLQGQAWWWCAGAQGELLLQVTVGLPQDQGFIDLMSARPGGVPAGPGTAPG